MGTMYQAFRSDPDAEKNGVIIDYGAFRVTVARAGGANKAYQRTLERLSRPFRRAIQTETLENEKASDLLKAAYAESVIRNWEVKQPDGTWVVGIEAESGELLPFTKDNLIATFNALPDLFSDLMEQAGKAALYRASLRDEAAGN
jgi:hypothetical protein